MPRYRLTIEYDGSAYFGYQAQAEHPSVQAALQRAIVAFCGETPTIHAAGRTDTGVHALGQVVTFDLDRAWPAATVQNALNAHLRPEPIVVLAASETDPEFHARFSATGRRYLYRILNRRAPPALDRRRVWHLKGDLDHEAMHAAAQCLVGQHDFTTFRHAHCQAKSPVKTLDVATVFRAGEEVQLIFAARSFLHRQVRSMTGSLVEVGLGRWQVADMAKALHAADRTACGQVAPPDGLYLTGVDYPNAAK